MAFDAFVWVDLEFPSEPKDCMNRWKQSFLDGGKWSDWGGFGSVTGPVKGFETVAAVLAQAARYAAMQRIQGKQFIFSVALGPTQVKVRAAFDKSQAEWWHALACMARASAPLDAVGEFGYATAAGNGGRESYVALIADGNSQFKEMGPDELRRLDRHPAVVELEAKRAELATAAPPVPMTLTPPPPRPPGSGRGYRRRGFGGPRPAPVAPRVEHVDADAPPDEEALVGGLDDEVAAVDLDAAPDADGEADTSETAEHGEGGDDDSPPDDLDADAGHDHEEAPRRRGRPPGKATKPAAAKPAAAKPVAAKPAPKAPEKAPEKPPKAAAKPIKKAAEKPAKPAKPAPAKKKPAKAK